MTLGDAQHGGDAVGAEVVELSKTEVMQHSAYQVAGCGAVHAHELCHGALHGGGSETVATEEQLVLLGQPLSSEQVEPVAQPLDGGAAKGGKASIVLRVCTIQGGQLLLVAAL